MIQEDRDRKKDGKRFFGGILDAHTLIEGKNLAGRSHLKDAAEKIRSVEILKSHKVGFRRENFGPYDQSLGSIKFLNLVDSTIALCRILLSNHYYVYLRTALLLWTEMKILMVGKLSPLFHEVPVT